jgi:hypothetical protein
MFRSFVLINIFRSRKKRRQKGAERWPPCRKKERAAKQGTNIKTQKTKTKDCRQTEEREREKCEKKTK